MKLKNDGNESITNETELSSTNDLCKDITKKENHNFYVYSLVDPTTDLPFYIGKGKNDRDKSHIKETMRGKIPHGNKHLYHTIKSILENGKSVRIVRIFENLSEKKALSLEIEYIKKYGRRNLNSGCLTNLTDGGEGTSNILISDERRESMILYGKIKYPNGFGTKESYEKVRLSHIKTGHKPPTPDWSIRKNPMLGKTHTEASKEKIKKARANYNGKNHSRYRLYERNRNYTK
jgi:hypothetical protein